MRDSWFRILATEGSSLELPGIYIWWIEAEPVYVGKSVRPRNRIRQYGRNIQRMDSGQKYHIAGVDFRDIHKQLWNAKNSNKLVWVDLVENCSLEKLNERERFFQKEFLGVDQRLILRMFGEHSTSGTRSLFYVATEPLNDDLWRASQGSFGIPGMPTSTPESAARDLLKRNGYHVMRVD